MAELVIYTKAYCGYCGAAKRLLDKKAVAYREIDVTSDRARWGEMVQRSGRTTVPQIFIDGKSVGGFTDLAALDRQGRLDGMLGLAPKPTAGSEPDRSGTVADKAAAWLKGLVSGDDRG